MGDVELPPDAESESDLDLPPPLTDSDDEIRCCSRKCHKHIADAEALRASQLAMPPEQHKLDVFEKVKHHVVHEGGAVVRRTRWTVQGEPVCRPFFEWCNAVGHATLDSYCKMAREGALVLHDERMPRLPRTDVGKASMSADAWFLDVYRRLAEPQAIADDALVDDRGVEVLSDASHPLWATGVNLPGAADQRTVPTQYLNPGCFEDLWLQYETSTVPEQRVSKSTLYKVWKQNWERVLRFRNVGQGKRCKVCARLDEERVQATTDEERMQIGRRKQEHIDEILADRAVTGRSISISEHDARKPNEDGHDQLMTITIDGMDQAKFKVPRNLASSADFESLWRPPLHVTGAIAHGHLESYFILDTDVAKDSNMNATIMSRMMDLVKEKLGVHALPRNLAVQADNTTRESKNQHFLLYLSTLIAAEKFDAADLQFLQCGHTHNEQDQRFSTVATSLSRAPVLEDPEEFAAWIRNNVKPARGRTLHVEVLDSTYDFQSWLQNCGVQVSGLAATHAEPRTTHCWRICRRSLLPEVGTVIETWDGGNDESDAVLMVKELLHHTQLTQQPLVILPHAVAMSLPSKLTLNPRNPIGERALKEFRKTAIAVSQDPWRLLKARQYLEELCRRSQAGEEPKGVPLDFIYNYKMPARRIGSCVFCPIPGSLEEPDDEDEHAVRTVALKPAVVPKAAVRKAAAVVPKAVVPKAAVPKAAAPKPAAVPKAAVVPKAVPKAAAVPAAAVPKAAPKTKKRPAAAIAAAESDEQPAPEPAAAPGPAAPENRVYGCSKCRGSPGCSKSCVIKKTNPWTKDEYIAYQVQKAEKKAAEAAAAAAAG